MHPDYDPFVDIAWDDEQTPILKNKQMPQKEDNQPTVGSFYRSDGAQWPCYICYAPTDVSLYMGKYTLRLHPICAIQHKIVEAPEK